ncbi:MAG: low molecular weight phosphatase family protein [Thioalkalivibrio sp.]
MASGKANLRRKPHLLFVSQTTSGRTPMVEVYGTQLLKDLVEVRAAGMDESAMDPRTREVLKQDGLDATNFKARRLDKELLDWADLIITLCVDVQRIKLPQQDSFVHKNWPIDSPVRLASDAQDIKPFVHTRDEIKRRLKQLSTSMRLMYR